MAPMAETKVFVSYRRADAQYVAPQLRDRLIAAFGTDAVFFDAVSIRLGEDFRTKIRSEVRRSDAVLVLVGARFQPERLAADDDPVRLEIAEALRQQKLVVPVLLEDADMPASQDLPPELRPFCDLNAARLRPYPDFDADTTRLVAALESFRPPAETSSAMPPPGPAAGGGAATEPTSHDIGDRPTEDEATATEDGATVADPPAAGPQDARIDNAFSGMFAVAVPLFAIAVWMLVGAGPGTGGFQQVSSSGFVGMSLIALAGLIVLGLVTVAVDRAADKPGADYANTVLGCGVFIWILLFVGLVVILDLGFALAWALVAAATTAVYPAVTEIAREAGSTGLGAARAGIVLAIAWSGLFLGTAQAVVGDTQGFWGVLGRLVDHGVFGPG